MINWQDITQQVNAEAGLRLRPGSPRRISGGCINQAYVIGVENQQVFIKLNNRSSLTMFQAEALGLEAISASASIRVPHPFSVGTSGSYSYIAMEYIQTGSAGKQGYERFGRQLAEMHRYQSSCFGAAIDNTIGSTPQINQQEDNWYEFWRKHRLMYQLDLARQNRAPAALYDEGIRLAHNFHHLFKQPSTASCLHGDLWQGNWGFDNNGNPFIFDPAHYFGDRETDLAMTRLFGGAPDIFYKSYREAYPLEEGYQIREKFYNIYHVLNHYNLFGGGYDSQAIDMIRYVLSELN